MKGIITEAKSKRISMYFFIVFIASPVIWDLVAATDAEPHPLSDEFIDTINKQGKWTAGRNFDPGLPVEYFTRLMGTDLRYVNSSVPRRTYSSDLIKTLPETFDARQKWPYCPSLNEIRDQGSCGSCWAFGAVEAMTDRYCIDSNGDKNFHFSAEDLNSCDFSNGGCKGGFPDRAWAFWVSKGIVSGGNYGSNEGCRPYSIPKSKEKQSTPLCEKKCRDEYNITYEDDKKYGKSSYSLIGENDMMADIFLNGPIESAYIVYSDFLCYKKGVYERQECGIEVGGHAVKILGWGVEDGKKYWLVANSWGENWGDKGYFKIKRGTNECEIELLPSVAGKPKL